MVCFFSFLSVGNAQILKVQLSSENNCNGELQIGLYIKASQYSPLDFKIGSSSLFLNYDPSVITYSSYEAEKFHGVGSADAGSWIDQRETADDECGLFNLVLQLENNEGPNLFLTKQNVVHVGTVYFDILMESTDPMIFLNQRFTRFNRGETNDGTQEIFVEDFPKVMDYLCFDNCGAAPIINNLVSSSATCLNNNGSISLSFPNNANHSNIEFSIDAGFTYPYNTPDNAGSFTIEDLSSGEYDLWARWEDDACPTDISNALVLNSNGPTSTFVSQMSCGNEDNGIITFSFPDHPTRTGVEFSIDGGFSFPYYSDDNAGSYDATGIGSGGYNLWMRWGDDSCPTSLGFLSVASEDFPMLSMFDLDICGDQNNGIIEFTFDDHPQYSNIEISIDGGTNFPYTVNDLMGSYEVSGLANGSYDVWARWKYFQCKNFIGTIVIGNDDPPVVNITSVESCQGNTIGEISFSFADHPSRTHIEFSIDNGNSFTTVEDNSGSFSFTDLAPGYYNTWIRWGNNECPINIGAYAVPVDTGPDVFIYSKENSCLNQNNGSITFAINDEPGYSQVEISLDNGYSYPFQYPDNIGFATIGNLASDIYSIWVRRSNDLCEKQLSVSYVQEVDCTTCSDGILNGDEEYIDCGGSQCMPCDMCPYNSITVSETPIPDNLTLRTGDWIKSDGHVSQTGNVTFKALNYIELNPEFEVLPGGALYIDIETCTNNRLHDRESN